MTSRTYFRKYHIANKLLHRLETENGWILISPDELKEIMIIIKEKITKRYSGKYVKRR